MSLTSLQILIPVYNEAESIYVTLEQIRQHVSIPHTISVIYDFDEDNTVPAVTNYIHKNNLQNIKLLKNIYGNGVLNALKTGFQSCSDGVALVVMADCSDDMRIVETMFEKINQGYDIVCGSRYMKGGRQIGGPLIKRLMSSTAGVSLHLLTGIPAHDISNSFRMYRTDVFKHVKLESTGGFEIGMEILVKSYLSGNKITEVPSTWRDRTAGKSRFKLIKWLPKYFHWYFYAINGCFRNQFNKIVRKS